MKSNNLVTKSKINTHSLKAENLKFMVNAEVSNFPGEFEIIPIPMDTILNEPSKHVGKHYLVYVVDAEEIDHKAVINEDELKSVVAQLEIELGVPVELIGVVNE